MIADQRRYLEDSRERWLQAYLLVEASVNRTTHVDRSRLRSPEELEPFDALSDQ